MAWNAKTEKMALVAFQRENDIQMIGHLVEKHYEREKEWPHFDTDELEFNSGIFKRPYPDLSILSIVQWEELDELRAFCAEKFFDLIVIESISNTFRIRGNMYRFDVPMQLYIPQLIRKLD
jgi:hypothetical protein